MYRMVIVDDQQVFLEKIYDSVMQFIRKKGTVAEVVCYERPELLRYDILEEKMYDVYVLDVEMPGMNGMQLGEEIRLRDQSAIIIFITSHVEYSLQAFEVQAQHYILKSQVEQKLPEVLEKVYKMLGENEKFYLIATNSRCEKIYYKDIYCFYKDGKNTVFITSKGNTFIRETIQNVFKELNAKEFIYIDRGMVVNIVHVMRIHSCDLYMRNGQQLIISKSNMKNVKMKVHEYWKGQLS